MQFFSGKHYFPSAAQPMKKFLIDIVIVLFSGMGKGRDGIVPRFFVPVPLVPQTSVPVPVPRDTKSAGTDRDSRPAGQSREARHI